MKYKLTFSFSSCCRTCRIVEFLISRHKTSICIKAERRKYSVVIIIYAFLSLKDFNDKRNVKGKEDIKMCMFYNVRSLKAEYFNFKLTLEISGEEGIFLGRIYRKEKRFNTCAVQ